MAAEAVGGLGEAADLLGGVDLGRRVVGMDEEEGLVYGGDCSWGLFPIWVSALRLHLLAPYVSLSLSVCMYVCILHYKNRGWIHRECC